MKNKLKILKVLISVGFIFFLIYLFLFLDIKKYINLNVLLCEKKRFDSLGISGVFIVYGFYFLFALIYMPIAFLSIFSGYMFGLLPSFLIVYTGSLLNMFVSFYWTRLLFRDFFNKLISKNLKLKSILDKTEENGYQFIFYSRLFFIVPYNSLNIVAAVSNISNRDYILGTIYGSIIQAIFYSFIGSRLSELLKTGNPEKQIFILSLVVVGFLLIIVAGKNFIKFKKKSSTISNQLNK